MEGFTGSQWQGHVISREGLMGSQVSPQFDQTTGLLRHFLVQIDLDRKAHLGARSCFLGLFRQP